MRVYINFVSVAFKELYPQYNVVESKLEFWWLFFERQRIQYQKINKQDDVV